MNLPKAGELLDTLFKAYSICTNFPVGLNVVNEKLYSPSAIFSFIYKYVYKNLNNFKKVYQSFKHKKSCT